jgi:hypothetical protein
LIKTPAFPFEGPGFSLSLFLLFFLKSIYSLNLRLLFLRVTPTGTYEVGMGLFIWKYIYYSFA